MSQMRQCGRLSILKNHTSEKSIMKKPKLVPLAAIFILLSSVVQAEAPRAYREAAGEDVKTTVYDGAYDDMSKAEIIREIRDEVDADEDILEQIPELKRQKGEDGKYTYSYLVKGKQIALEDVDENILRTLIGQVEAKAAQLRTNAILEQQEQLRTIRNINAVRPPPQAPPRPPAVPQRPPTPPRK